VTGSDSLAEIRTQFAMGLDGRVEAMRLSLSRLELAFRVEDANSLSRTAHSLVGTAASFGAEALADAARELENLALSFCAAKSCGAEERAAATTALARIEEAARKYQSATASTEIGSLAARMAVVGELTSLINANFDLEEIFRSAILKVRRVLDFRRASVVLTDNVSQHYYLHTLYDSLRGGFLTKKAVFSIEQGLTGEAIRSGQPIRVDSLPGTEGILSRAGRRVSAMIVPLRVGGQVIGALNFGHENSGRYTAEDLEWAVVISRQIETALYYSKLLSTIAQQREDLAREHATVQRHERQLEALIDASDAAIMLVGRDRTIVYANAMMARLAGIPREVAVGATLDRIHQLLGGSFADRDALAPQERAISSDEPLNDQVEITFPSRAVYKRVVARVRDQDESLIGHIVLYRDVTREVEADRMKSEFVSVVSHEVRTPMTSMKTALSLLLAGAGGPLEARARELLETCVRNIDRLTRLVGDLLDLSRIKAGRTALHPEPVSLEQAVKFGVETVRAFAADKAVKIELRPPPQPVWVLGTQDRLVQVIVNLLSNAIKFSSQGTQVTIRWWREDDWVIAEVADQGPGIPADKLRTIFEPFLQLDSSFARAYGGTGLGLTISQDIVQAIGGQLWAESEVGKGSRFFVRLAVTTEAVAKS
jgi:signal transduction histidine kinase/HPt (histidine-containing phosphotransfer) domain-containing protein